MDNPYFTLCMMLVGVILIVAVFALIGFISIDQYQDRKQKIWDELTQQGATNIAIETDLVKSLSGGRRYTLEKFKDDVYLVQYKDASGVMHKTTCTFSQVTGQMYWQDKL